MREAIILAGGFGTRLRHVIPDLPKVMAPIAGRPFLAILLASLAVKGFGRAVLSLGFMAEKIQNYFAKHRSPLDLTYVVEDEPLGTGGAVRKAMASCHEDHMFVFNGDTFIDLEVEAVERHWQRNRRPVIIARQVANAARYGRLLISDGRVSGFSEKGTTGAGLINAGCYVFNSGQLDQFPIDQPFSLETDFLARSANQLAFDVFETKGQFIDIGIPEDYYLAQTELARLS